MPELSKASKPEKVYILNVGGIVFGNELTKLNSIQNLHIIEPNFPYWKKGESLHFEGNSLIQLLLSDLLKIIEEEIPPGNRLIVMGASTLGWLAIKLANSLYLNNLFSKDYLQLLLIASLPPYFGDELLNPENRNLKINEYKFNFDQENLRQKLSGARKQELEFLFTEDVTAGQRTCMTYGFIEGPWFWSNPHFYPKELWKESGSIDFLFLQNFLSAASNILGYESLPPIQADIILGEKDASIPYLLWEDFKASLSPTLKSMINVHLMKEGGHFPWLVLRSASPLAEEAGLDTLMEINPRFFDVLRNKVLNFRSSPAVK